MNGRSKVPRRLEETEECLKWPWKVEEKVDEKMLKSNGKLVIMNL